MRLNVVATAIALAVSAGFVLVPSAAGAEGMRLSVFGDTDVTPNAQANVNRAIAEGSDGYVGLGDYGYDASASTWKTLFAPLTSRGAWMALGNHDDYYGYASLFPNGPQWSAAVAGARIVAINTESNMAVGSSQYNAVRSALCNAQETVRIVIMHKPWWLLSGAHHPGYEFPGSASAMDQMMKNCKVSLVLAGHEHNYQRMVRNGVNYAIVGTGGRSLYPLAGMPGGTVASCACYGQLLLDVDASGYSATFKTTGGSVKDTFSFSPSSTVLPAPGPSGPVSFTASTGNDWWVQVKVSPTPDRVEARDTNGAWVPLSLKSWGAWAGSFRVEPGNLVQYRATTGASGTESCWFTHPAGACTSTAPAPAPAPAPPGDVLFSASSGNEWWVQVKVSPPPSRMEARDTNGAWVPIFLKSWGAWAGSFHVEPGHLVQYRATTAAGGVVESCWFTHPAGVCASAAPAPGSPVSSRSFSATFKNVRGNAWWVETDVSVSGGTLAGVDARVNGAAWVALDLKSWGSWAKSVTAPSGSTVEFRARATDGAVATSASYAWPPG